MSIAIWRRLLTAVAAGGWLVLAGCRSPAVEGKIAGGDDGLSFFGEARGRLEFGKVPVIRFEQGSWRLAEAEADRLGDALGVLSDGSRVLLVGVGDARVPGEHGRQQALARALVVRSELVRRGAEGAAILVTGVSAEESVGLLPGGAIGPRVECAVIHAPRGTEER